VTSFLVDQQLPLALAKYLDEHGYDARHIKEYPGGSTMPDPDVAHLADSETRFVVTKDDDFRISHLLGKPPARLLHVTCGNISTRDLLTMVEQHWPEFCAAISTYRYLDINRVGVIIHDPAD
jgi:predicted nuclease of predicted toxin-antitoxin system